MHGRILVAILFGAVPYSPALAQSFDAALAEAYQTNPQLQAARAQLREVDEGVPQALSGWRPKVTITGSVGAALYDDSIDATHRPEHRAPQDYALRFEQPVYTSGRVAAQVDQAKQRVRSQRANLLSTEEQVLLGAGTAYLDVVRDRRLLELQRNNVALLDRTLRASTQQLAVGAVTPADTDQVHARLADARAQLASALAQLRASEANFRARIGAAPGAVAVPTRRFGAPATREAAVAAAVRDNPDVGAAEAALDASRSGIDVERAGLLPQIALHGLFERARQTEIQQYGQRDNVAQGTLDVTIPIYQGGEEYSRIRQAKETTQRFESLVEQARREAERQASTAWDALDAARARVAAQQEAITANAAALRGITLQQSVGARTVLDVLNAQLEELTSNVALVSAQHDALVATLSLVAAVGGLSAQGLALPVTPYDPARHYDAVHDKWIGATPP